MIKWGTGANQVQVECLTRLPAQRIEVRLSGRRKTPNLPPTVILEEPEAEEFAVLRTAAVEAEDKIEADFPEPRRPPDVIPGETDYERTVRMSQFLKDLAEVQNTRHAHRTDPQHAPFAKIMVDAINMLSEYTVALNDLPPECYKGSPIAGLLEVWETPLGGPVSPVETPATPTWAIPSVAAEPSIDPPSDQPEVASPESTPSSPPGGKPSPPSPLLSSTR